MRTLRVATALTVAVAVAVVPAATDAKSKKVKAGRYQSTYSGKTKQGLPIKIVTIVQLIKSGNQLVVGETPKVTAATKVTFRCEATESHGAVQRTVAMTGNPSGLMLTTSPEGADLNGSLTTVPGQLSGSDRVAASLDGRVKFKNYLPTKKSVMKGSVRGAGTFQESGFDDCLGGGPDGTKYTAKWVSTKRVH